MGNWNINIVGAGQHHNGQPRDVEQLTAEFIDRLRANGHTVTAGIVTTGGVVDVSLGKTPAAALYGAKASKDPAGAPPPPGYVAPVSDGKIYGDAGS